MSHVTRSESLGEMSFVTCARRFVLYFHVKYDYRQNCSVASASEKNFQLPAAVLFSKTYVLC